MRSRRNQPVTPVMDTVRSLLSVAGHAVAWSLRIIAVSVVLAGAMFQRRTA